MPSRSVWATQPAASDDEHYRAGIGLLNKGLEDAAAVTLVGIQVRAGLLLVLLGVGFEEDVVKIAAAEVAGALGDVWEPTTPAKKRARKPHPTLPGHDIAGKKTPTLSDLVDELARAYGGSVQLGEAPLGGLRVTLDLPRAVS